MHTKQNAKKAVRLVAEKAYPGVSKQNKSVAAPVRKSIVRTKGAWVLVTSLSSGRMIRTRKLPRTCAQSRDAALCIKSTVRQLHKLASRILSRPVKVVRTILIVYLRQHQIANTHQVMAHCGSVAVRIVGHRRDSCYGVIDIAGRSSE